MPRTKKTKTTAKKGSMKKMAQPKMSAMKIIKDKPMSKSEILTCIAECAMLSRKQVSDVLYALEEVISAHIKKGGVGTFSLPGLLKLYVVRKPATKARKGKNPFTGEEVMFKAKPARNVVKIKALKKLKEKVV
jgi:nucleoid DNA-binding protein